MVFVAGMERSGTTMIASQLGACDETIVLPELHFFASLVEHTVLKQPADKIYDKITGHRKFNTLEIELDRLEIERVYTDNGLEGVLSVLLDTYLKKHDIDLSGDREYVWIEHYPGNVLTYPLMRTYFSNAKFIHVVRDPRAIYGSVKHLPRWNYGEPIKLANDWIYKVAKGIQLRKLYPTDVYQLRYEDFVSDASELEKLCTFIGISFNQQMQEGGGVVLPAFTKGQHALTTGPSDPSRINAWQKKITSREAEVISAYCYEWMLSFGYLQDGLLFSKPSTRERLYWLILRMKTSLTSKIARIISLRLNAFRG